MMRQIRSLILLVSCTAGIQASAELKTPPKTETSPTPASSATVTVQLEKPAELSKEATAEITRLNAEKDKLTAEIALAQAKLDKELSESKMNAARIQAQLTELKAREELNDFKIKVDEDKQLAELKKQMTRVSLESAIAKAEAETEAIAIKRRENNARRETSELTLAMELEQKQAESRTYAMQAPVYLKEPQQGNKLVISDRRIPLNGPITSSVANVVTERINYYNNRDREMPIFIVIDDSPGGSVMAGYKILKAMQGSDAPVYVVVKSFAASMAACITTLAEKSYAYPNAVILHHQISSFSGGNLTQQQEWVKEMEEWWKRLADPVAEKMGITREEFIKRMYQHTSSGDWNEFGDNAVKLKWVDSIVEEIQETSTIRLETPVTPSATPSRVPAQGDDSGVLTEQKDEKGRPYLNLPRVNPFDCYWMYNPDGYFRVP